MNCVAAVGRRGTGCRAPRTDRRRAVRSGRRCGCVERGVRVGVMTRAVAAIGRAHARRRRRRGPPGATTICRCPMARRPQAGGRGAIRVIRSATASSRPKNRWRSAASNASRPRYGARGDRRGRHQSGPGERADRLRALDSLQVMMAELDDRVSAGQRVSHEPRRALGHQDLAARGFASDARGEVQDRAVVLAVAHPRRARVQSKPGPDRVAAQ